MNGKLLSLTVNSFINDKQLLLMVNNSINCKYFQDKKLTVNNFINGN